MDESALPALTIAELAYQVSMVIVAGNSSAISVLIGSALGAGELDKARDNSKKLATLTLVVGLVSMRSRRPRTSASALACRPTARPTASMPQTMPYAVKLCRLPHATPSRN